MKGSDCLEQFRVMQECMQHYPELYPQEDEMVPKEHSSETDPTSQDSVSAESSGANLTFTTEKDSSTVLLNTENPTES